ncbi:MAG TPA: signal peptidase I [Anaerolineales bacterium]|nr:signal peptidase I [Anaerolineales bacterium]
MDRSAPRRRIASDLSAEKDAGRILAASGGAEPLGQPGRRNALQGLQPGYRAPREATPHAQPLTATRMRPWTWVWAPAGGLAALTYLLIHFGVDRWLPGELSTYIVQPLLWSYVALMAALFYRYGLWPRPRFGFSIGLTAAVLGVFQVALFTLAGLFSGFGESPYAHHPLALLGNAGFAATQLAAMEAARGCVTLPLARHRPTLTLLLAALFLAALRIPPAQLAGVIDFPTLARFLGERLLPTFASSILSCLLVVRGGPFASLLYQGSLQAYEWFSPVLPRLDWLVTAFLGTMAPALGLMVLSRDPVEITREKGQVANQRSWMSVAALAVSLYFFNSGLLGVRPTLVVGASMEPTLHIGDVVVTSDVPPEEVQVGDIVRFRTGQAFVLHRVIEIEQRQGEVFFLTRGDSNNVSDPLLPAERVEGRLVFVVPKVGWLSIMVHRALTWFR